jgi:hypothetical protein
MMQAEDGKAFPMLDFLSVGCALPSDFSSLAATPLSQKHRVFLDHSAKVSAGFLQERIGAAVQWLATDIMLKLMVYSRMDSQVLGCRLDDQPAAAGHPDAEAVKKDLEQGLETARLQTDDGRTFPLADCSSVGWVLPQLFEYLAAAPLAPKHRRFLEEAAVKASAFQQEWLPWIEKALRVDIQFTMLRNSRIDQAVFGCLLTPHSLQPGKPLFRLTLTRGEPRESRVEIEGKVRPVYQCGLPDWTDGVRWLEADGEPFGLKKGRTYPVCIQSHALRKLTERFPTDWEVQVVVQHGLLESLASLAVAEEQGDAYLIAFHVRGLRLGYFVARAVQDRIVLCTFLFLTMQGTPEARLLGQKLRLCRRDIEHLNLDRLETYLSPDVLQDPQLVGLLEECGCGSLLELARHGFPYDTLTGRAEDLRRFLRVTDGHQRPSSRFSSPQAKLACGASLAS